MILSFYQLFIPRCFVAASSTARKRSFACLPLLLVKLPVTHAAPHWFNATITQSTSSLSATTEYPNERTTAAAWSATMSGQTASISSTYSTTSTSAATLGSSACLTIQSDSLSYSRFDAAKAEAVKEAFLRSWNQYSYYCFDILPSHSFCGDVEVFVFDVLGSG